MPLEELCRVFVLESYGGISTLSGNWGKSLLVDSEVRTIRYTPISPYV